VGAGVADDPTRKMPALIAAEKVADLALSIGETQLAAGASAAEVTGALEQILDAYGLVAQRVVDVTYASLTISYRGRGNRNETLVRVVRHRAQDYHRLIGVNDLVRDIGRTTVTIEDAQERLDKIVNAEHPYRRYMAVAAWATMAAAIGVQFGAGVYGATGAAISAALIYWIGRVAHNRNLPLVTSQLAGAIVAVAIAVGLHLTGLPANPSLVVVSGIITLMAGMTFVGAVSDALTGYYLTAAARLLEVGLLTGGVIAGVSFGLEAAAQLGVTFDAAPEPRAITQLPLILAASAVTAVTYAYGSYAPKKCLLPVAACAVVGQLVAVSMTTAGFDGPWSAAAAAMAISCLGYTIAPLTRTPGLVIIGSGIIPLLPGLSVYRGLYDLTGDANINGILTLFTAAALAAGIATGALMGERMSHPILRALGRKTPRWTVRT
jgi:uncharacterized membrane protein YjjP (DUF1212 family)